MNNLPIWLLDVDGVLNIDDGSAWRSPHKQTTLGGLRIRWAPDLINAIRGLHEQGMVEIRWSTSWCGFPELLDDLERTLRLPAFERAFGNHNGFFGDLKLAAARQALIEQRPMIWTDDDEVPAKGSPLHRELHRPGRSLLIRPHWRSGLTPAHLERITNFCRKQTLQPVD